MPKVRSFGLSMARFRSQILKCEMRIKPHILINSNDTHATKHPDQETKITRVLCSGLQLVKGHKGNIRKKITTILKGSS